MEQASFFVSIAALALSALTFYWVNLREKKNFYLLRVDRIGAFSHPEFALVNGGSKDILITKVECAFIGSETNRCLYPMQRIECGKSGELLLSAGTAVHCRVDFPEPFTSSFAAEGVVREGTTPIIYEHTLRIDVAWINSNGENYSTSVNISKLGFRESGEPCSMSPLEEKHDLLKAALTRK